MDRTECLKEPRQAGPVLVGSSQRRPHDRSGPAFFGDFARCEPKTEFGSDLVHACRDLVTHGYESDFADGSSGCGSDR